jgi:hypothetical protein
MRLTVFGAIPWVGLAISMGANAWLLAGRQNAATAPAALLPSAAVPGLAAGHEGPHGSAPAVVEEAGGDAVRSAPMDRDGSAAIGAYADWMAGRLATAEQISELNRVLTYWLAVDPQAASGWLLPRIKDGRFDEAAKAVSSWLVAHGEFDRASEWARAIRGSEVRLRAIEEIYAEAFRNDLIDVEELKASGLPEERIAGILDYSRLD